MLGLNLLAAVPAKAWAALALAAALAWAGHVAYNAGGKAVQQRWDAATAQATTEALQRQAAARETERIAGSARANLEAKYAQTQAAAAAAAAGTAGTLASLRSALVAQRASATATGPPTPAGADAAGPARRALAECADQLATLAGVADQLSNQVSGLQSYVRDVAGPVCITGLAAKPPP